MVLDLRIVTRWPEVDRGITLSGAPNVIVVAFGPGLSSRESRFTEQRKRLHDYKLDSSQGRAGYMKGVCHRFESVAIVE